MAVQVYLHEIEYEPTDRQNDRKIHFINAYQICCKVLRDNFYSNSLFRCFSYDDLVNKFREALFSIFFPLV